jgi:hypothetical protein
MLSQGCRCGEIGRVLMEVMLVQHWAAMGEGKKRPKGDFHQKPGSWVDPKSIISTFLNSKLLQYLAQNLSEQCSEPSPSAPTNILFLCCSLWLQLQLPLQAQQWDVSQSCDVDDHQTSWAWFLFHFLFPWGVLLCQCSYWKREAKLVILCNISSSG